MISETRVEIVSATNMPTPRYFFFYKIHILHGVTRIKHEANNKAPGKGLVKIKRHVINSFLRRAQHMRVLQSESNFR